MSNVLDMAPLKKIIKCIFIILESYSPLADSCIDFYKLGISPMPSQCLTLKGITVSTLQCCWNNLIASTTVSLSIKCHFISQIKRKQNLQNILAMWKR